MKRCAPYLRIVAFVAIVVLSVSGLDYLLAPSGYIRYLMHQVTESDQNMDLIFLGASHTRSAINPQPVADKLNVNAYSLGIPGETVLDSYYLTEQALEHNDIKTVVYDADFQYWIIPQMSGQVYQSFVYSQLQSPKIKLEYIKNNRNTMEFRTVIGHRSSYDMSLSGIKQNLSMKKSAEYKNYSIGGALTPDANGPYVGRGFFLRELSGNEPGGKDFVVQTYAQCHEPLTDSAKDAFARIKALCDEKGIELIAVTSPIDPTACEVIDMQFQHDQLNAFFESQGVKYYDFNMALETVVPRRDADYGDYEGHMGGELTTIYSTQLANLLSDVKNGTYDASKYFYSSFADMYANMQKDYEKTTGLSWHVGEGA